MTLPFLLFYIFIGLIVIQLFYYLGIFSGFAFSKPNENNPKKIPVSVIVYAKNQAEEMKQLLPILLNQNYHTFELVLVNNASIDETLEVFKEFASYVPFIKIVDVENNEAFWGSQKYALTLGIKAATHEYLLFLDAKDQLNSPNWIMQMSSYFTLNKTLVMGLTKYPKAKGFFNRFLRFDATFSQVQTLSWSKIGRPFTLQLANIGYKKELYYATNGFMDFMQTREFTNELFVYAAAKEKNTAICEWNEVAIHLPLPENYATYFKEKKKQAQLLSQFSFSQQWIVRFYYFSTFLLYAMALTLLLLQFQLYIVIGLIAFRMALAWLITSRSLKKLDQKDLRRWFLILEPLQLFTQVRLFIANLGTKNNL